MEFKITEAQAREMAKLEEEVGCDLNVGPDWGIQVDRVMELALDSTQQVLSARSKHSKFVDLLSEQFGNVLSLEEIEEVASSFQIQIQERLAGKVTH